MAIKKQKDKGIKSIKVSLYFYTSGADGVRLPKKHCYNAGWAQLPTNIEQGIRAKDAKPVHFKKGQRTMAEAINEALKSQDIKILEEDKEKDFKRYLEEQNTFFKKKVE